MSWFWWFFGALFITIGIYYAFVGYDRHSERKKQLRIGTVVNGAVVAGPNPNPPMSQPTMIYTIPTTHQLSQQYPQLVATSYPYQPQHQQGHSQNSPPPYSTDMPPTYEQVVIYPSGTTNTTTITHSQTERQTTRQVRAGIQAQQMAMTF